MGIASRLWASVIQGVAVGIMTSATRSGSAPTRVARVGRVATRRSSRRVLTGPPIILVKVKYKKSASQPARWCTGPVPPVVYRT